MNQRIKKIVRKYDGCTACPLHSRAHNYVWFRGACPCDVLFIGEAPGKDEDLVGEPFVGRAGDVLNAWVPDAYAEIMAGLPGAYVSLPYFSWGVTNLVRCIPLDDNSKLRVPTKAEAAACSPILQETILAANPRLIILLGREAEKHHKIPTSLAHVPVVHIQHPASILRNGGIGSIAYDQGLVRLIEALETHLYASPSQTSKERPSKEGKPKKRKKAKH